MADKITAGSVIDSQVKKEFQELLKLVDAMVNKFKEVQGAAKATDAELKKGIKTNQDFGKAKKEVVGASQMLADIEKEEQKLREKHYQLIVKATAEESKAGKEYKKTVEELKKKNAAEREAAKLADSESNSINMLIQRNKELTKERNKVNTATKEGKKRIQEINAEINRNNKSINENTSSLEKQKNNVGNYVSAFKNVGSQLLAVTGITVGLRGAMQLFNNVMMSTQATGDKLTHAKAALGGAFSSLFRTIAQGDFTFKTLIENMENGYTAAKNYSIALDEIGDIMRAVDLRSEESMDRLDELRVIMSETETKTLTERKNALVEYERINNEILESRINAANEIIKAERDRLKNDYNLTDEQVSLVENFVRNYDKLTKKELINVQKAADARDKYFTEKVKLDKLSRYEDQITSERITETTQELKNNYDKQINSLSESELAYLDLSTVIDGLVDVQRNQIADALKGIATANRAYSAAQRVAVRRGQQMVIEEQEAAKEQARIAKELANQKAIADKEYLDNKKRYLAFEAKMVKEANSEALQEYKDLEKEQLNALTQRFVDGKISAKAYADELLTIQIISLEQQLQYAKDNGLDVLGYETQLVALKKQLKDQETEHFVESEEKKRLSSMETLQQLSRIFTESTNLFAALNDRQLQALEEKRDYEIELAEESALGKKAAEQSYAKEVAKIKRKQAIADKAASLFNIALDTAQGVLEYGKNPFTQPLIPYIIALGAIQAATVLATPIPKFYKGVRNFEGGMALVGEQGAEIYRTPDNQLGITPNQATLMALPRGTDVYTHSESKQMIASNNIDVSELVLEQRKTRQAIASKSEYHTHIDKDGLRVLLRKGNNSITYADKYLRF